MSPLVNTPEPASHMERALRESEARLRSVIESAPMVLWALDRHGIFTFSEGKGLQALGLGAGEVVGRSAFEVYADIPEILDDCRRALAGEEFTSTVEAAGLVFESRYSTVRDQDGSIAGVIGVAIDVTERKRTAAELERSLSLLRTTLESTADGILVVDGAGKIVSSNGKFARMWGIPQVILDSGDDDRALSAVLDQLEDPDAFLDKVRELYERPEAESYDVLRFRDGRTFERFSQPQRLGSRVIGRVWSFRDVTERVKAEADLQEAYGELEQRVRERTAALEAIFHALPDLYVRLDAAGKIVDCRAGKNFDFLAPAEQLVGRTVQEILPAAEVSRVQDRLREVRTSEDPVSIEYSLPGQDGDREFEARLLPFLDDQVITVVRDITDQKRAERDLQRREERFRTLIENAYDMIQIVGPEGKIVYTGPSVTRLLGYTPEEICGTDALSYLHPEDRQRAAEALGEFLDRPGVATAVRYRVRHKDGAWRMFEAFGRTLSLESAEQGIVVNARDITERHEAEEALRQSEEHFRLLIENSSDVASILDANGVNRYQSPSSERVLGYTPEEMTGTSAFDRIHPDDVAGARETLGTIARNPGLTRTAEFRYRHKNGSWCTLEVSGRTLLPDSAEAGVVINSRDVTERRLAAEELRRAKEEAERANRAKSEFLSRMSHELRTPMNSILGFAQLLAKRELPADQRKGVDHILKAGRHLLNLINEVLDIARIEANRQPLSLEPVKVQATVQEALSLVRPMAEQRDCLLQDTALGCDDYVRADGQRLMQVLLNLLSNAIKYNRPGGSVGLSCERLPDEGTAGRRLCIRVHDTGRGIPPDRIEELFVPFSRLGAEHSDEEGTGLGLALSQRLVEAMGGRLLVESTPGEGSTFSVELPIVDGPLARLARTGASRALEGKSPDAVRPATLLYIEDNLANLSLIETIFASRPEITLVPALQGRLGLDLAWEHGPDLILLDLHLPDIPGEEVLRRLRGDDRTRETPVIIISADATPGKVKHLVAAGAHGYLTKPLDIDQFLDAVNGVLAGRAV